MPAPIPLSRVHHSESIDRRILEVVKSGNFILGPECKAFETELAQFFNVPHAVLSSSWTAAGQTTSPNPISPYAGSVTLTDTDGSTGTLLIWDDGRAFVSTGEGALAGTVNASGQVSLAGVARERMPASAWRRLVTYVAAESGWWEEGVAAHFADLDAARALLPRVRLDPALLQARVAQLSTGERQRLALLRAVVQRPRFLLLDEPTAALDAASREGVEQLLQALKAEGLGLLVVSHDAGQARRLADVHLQLDEHGLGEVQP